MTPHRRLKFALARMAFGKRARVNALRRVSAAMNDGLPLDGALRAAWLDASKSGARAEKASALALGHWLRDVRSGAPLSRAVRGWVPKGHADLVAAGERAGRLARALDNAVWFDAVAMPALRNAALAGLAEALWPLSWRRAAQ